MYYEEVVVLYPIFSHVQGIWETCLCCYAVMCMKPNSHSSLADCSPVWGVYQSPTSLAWNIQNLKKYAHVLLFVVFCCGLVLWVHSPISFSGTGRQWCIPEECRLIDDKYLVVTSNVINKSTIPYTQYMSPVDFTQRSSNVERWYIFDVVDLPVIWDAMPLICLHCNELGI